MKTITSLFKRLAYGTHDAHELVPVVNPSEVLHVHREDVTGTIELRNLDTDENPSKVLRVSWIKRNDVEGGDENRVDYRRDSTLLIISG